MRRYLTWVMSLTVLTYLIIAIALVSLLTGCAEFPIAVKMEEIRSEQLTCSGKDESMCAGWKE